MGGTAEVRCSGAKLRSLLELYMQNTAIGRLTEKTIALTLAQSPYSEMRRTEVIPLDHMLT